MSYNRGSGGRGGQSNNRRGGQRDNRGGRSGGRGGARRDRTLSKGTELYVLDRFDHGGMDRARHGWNPFVQIIIVPHFVLFEVEIKEDSDIKLMEKIVISGTESDGLANIKRKLKFADLSTTSKDVIDLVLEQYIKDYPDKFLNWINRAQSITIRRHYLELLPGVGKKLMKEILELRKIQPFESFDDLHERVPGFKPIHSISTRIVEELQGNEEEIKHHIFVKLPQQKPDRNSQSRNPRQSGGYDRNRNSRSGGYRRN